MSLSLFEKLISVISSDGEVATRPSATLNLDGNEGSIYKPSVSYLVLVQNQKKQFEKRKSTKPEDILEGGGLDDSRVSFENRELLSLLTSFRYDLFEIAGQFDMELQVEVMDYFIDKLKEIEQDKIAQLSKKIDLLMDKCLKRRKYKDFLDEQEKNVSTKYYNGSQGYKQKILSQYEIAGQEQDTYEGALQFLTCLKLSINKHKKAENSTDFEALRQSKEVGDKLIAKGWLQPVDSLGFPKEEKTISTPIQGPSHPRLYAEIKMDHFALSDSTASRTPTPDSSRNSGGSNDILESGDDSQRSSPIPTQTTTPTPTPTPNSTPPSSPKKGTTSAAQEDRKVRRDLGNVSYFTRFLWGVAERLMPKSVAKVHADSKKPKPIAKKPSSDAKEEKKAVFRKLSLSHGGNVSRASVIESKHRSEDKKRKVKPRFKAYSSGQTDFPRNYTFNEKANVSLEKALKVTTKKSTFFPRDLAFNAKAAKANVSVEQALAAGNTARKKPKMLAQTASGVVRVFQETNTGSYAPLAKSSATVQKRNLWGRVTSFLSSSRLTKTEAVSTEESESTSQSDVKKRSSPAFNHTNATPAKNDKPILNNVDSKSKENKEINEIKEEYDEGRGEILLNL